MADGVCAEAVVARLALHLQTGIRAAELAKIVLEIIPANARDAERLQEIAGLLRRKPDVFATLRATGAAVRHTRDEGETGAAVVTRLASSFDAAAAISETASVQLASLGDEERLSATTDEVVAWLKQQDFSGTHRDILDIGCGIGRFEHALSNSFNRMIGIDISSRMISIASERCAALGNVELRQTSGLDLSEFDDGSFDCVLAVDSFPYLVLAGMAEGHFDEIARVLKRPGWLALLNYSYRGSLSWDRADIGRLARSSPNAGRHQWREAVSVMGWRGFPTCSRRRNITARRQFGRRTRGAEERHRPEGGKHGTRRQETSAAGSSMAMTAGWTAIASSPINIRITPPTRRRRTERGRSMCLACSTEGQGNKAVQGWPATLPAADIAL
ncbi:class I SAM-dependent methyltransferase [Mesorhizobium sp. URHB0026]